MTRLLVLVALVALVTYAVALPVLHAGIHNLTIKEACHD